MAIVIQLYIVRGVNVMAVLYLGCSLHKLWPYRNFVVS